MSRKNLIKDLYTVVGTEKLAAANPLTEAPSKIPERVLAGPVRSMGLALGKIELENAALQEAIAAGSSVVDLDAELIESSFIRDRLPEAQADFDAFKQSIAERGQEVPILVRPHPKDEGRFQLAYGHRRTRACLELGRKVKAVVRDLTDMDLIVAQGVENSQRKDLSYIERALYALRLEQHGFERSVICDALAVDKGEVSKFISVATAIPAEIIQFIGPAPKTGRRRWLSLVEAIEAKDNLRKAIAATQDPSLSEADSDTLFMRVLVAASRVEPKSSKAQAWQSTTGYASVAITHTDKLLTLAFDKRKEPAFAEFVASQLDSLYEDFCARTKVRA